MIVLLLFGLVLSKMVQTQEYMHKRLAPMVQNWVLNFELILIPLEIKTILMWQYLMMINLLLFGKAKIKTHQVMEYMANSFIQMLQD